MYGERIENVGTYWRTDWELGEYFGKRLISSRTLWKLDGSTLGTREKTNNPTEHYSRGDQVLSSAWISIVHVGMWKLARPRGMLSEEEIKLPKIQ
jgi:hypothetical protein